MTKMATMTIYTKKLKNLLLQNRWLDCFWTLVCSIRWLSTLKFVQIVSLGWSWHIFIQVKFGSLGFWMEKICNHCLFFFFSPKTMVLFDMNKDASCASVNTKGQGHSMTLAFSQSDWMFVNIFLKTSSLKKWNLLIFQKLLLPVISKFVHAVN